MIYNIRKVNYKLKKTIFGDRYAFESQCDLCGYDDHLTTVSMTKPIIDQFTLCFDCKKTIADLGLSYKELIEKKITEIIRDDKRISIQYYPNIDGRFISPKDTFVEFDFTHGYWTCNGMYTCCRVDLDGNVYALIDGKEQQFNISYIRKVASVEIL